jgi:DNA-binding NarL/FixJ family response regulator
MTADAHISEGSRRSAMVVDRKPLRLESVDRILDGAGFDVRFKSVSSSSALASLDRFRPQLLVTGLRMLAGDVDGCELVRRARLALPPLKIVVFSDSHGDEPVAAALHAGADAFVRKAADPDDLAAAVRQAFEHSFFLPTTVPAPQPLLPPVEAPDLTRRERAIVKLVAEGHSDKQLARMLWVTEQTIRAHLSSIQRKLGDADGLFAAN